MVACCMRAASAACCVLRRVASEKLVHTNGSIIINDLSDDRIEAPSY